jgi:MFS transporter, CP family, cyanate transporter
LALIFLVGVDLRVVMLAVPPVIPAIHRDLSLDEKGIAALSSLPVLVLALAAVPGSLLIARLGARRALLAGLVVVAFAGAARGLIPLAALLFGMTFLMGVGIAVGQPASPSVVKDWFPAHVGLATAMYANGVLVGEILPVTMAPWILTAVRESWGLSLALGGAAWDVTGVPLSAFVPASLAGLVMIALAARLHLGPAPDRSSRQATAAHFSGNRPG